MKVRLVLCFVLAAALVTRLGAAAAERPNLLLIIADDCTKYDTELYGGQARTPNLMRLAQEGMNFTQCYQAAPMCSPTRHSLYTATYPVKTGAYPNHTFVEHGVTSVAQWLKAAGYRAALTGKTDIEPAATFPFDYLRRGAPVSRVVTEPDFDAVDRYLAGCRSSGTPFALFICSNEPHTPWNKGDPSAYPPAKLKLPPMWVDTPGTRAAYSKYLAEVTFFDGQVGRALALLDQHGLRDNTMVIVLTEQGNAFPYAKWTCYDAGVASALVVRWPGHVAPGSRTDALVEYIDLMPTFCAAANVAVPAAIDGQSFLPVLLGQATHHKDYVFSLQTTRGIVAGADHYGIRSVRDARYRYIRNLTPEAAFKNWAMTQSWFDEWRQAARGDPAAARLVDGYAHRPAEELYDCIDDPWNRHNLIADPARTETVATLRRELARWMEAQGDEGQPTEMAALKHLWKNAGGD